MTPSEPEVKTKANKKADAPKGVALCSRNRRGGMTKLYATLIQNQWFTTSEVVTANADCKEHALVCQGLRLELFNTGKIGLLGCLPKIIRLL